MKLPKQKRKRGIILTLEGLQKLQAAKMASEANENYGNRYTIEYLGERVGVNTATVSKVLSRSEAVDKKTLELFFQAFDLELDTNCYTSSDQSQRQDWGEAICVSVFYGRTEELATLEQWLVNDRCRLVAILGMGGMGKTALSVKLAEDIKEHFEYVIWRSLRESPPVKELLGNLIQFLSDQQETEAFLPESVGDRISRLINYLREHRCLLILDNFDSILQSGSRAGLYREGYEGYGELLKRVGETTHQSSLLLTSREKPVEVASLEGGQLCVRSFTLKGLKSEEGLEILKLKGITASKSELSILTERFGGNALALKVIATTIQDLFDGNISEFLKHETFIFGDIRDLLDQQFSRLPNLEKEIMYWLAINCEPVSLSELREDIISSIQPQKILEALESLLRRSLVEKSESLFTLQPVVMEYVTQRFLDQVCKEIETHNIDLFRCHALMKATAKDYVREVQIRLILQPVIDGLLTVLKSKRNIENKLTQILATLRETSPLEQSYTAGSILNLLCHLETDLSGYNFSYLSVWQGDLRNVNLHNANLAHAHLTKCVFADTIGGIHSVAFSPDDKLLATGDTNNEVRLYQIADGKHLLTCKGHTDWVWPVTFSPDGYIVASGSVDQTIKLWTTKSGECIETLQGHNGGIWSVAFDPDGRMLVSGSDDQTVKLWNLSTGQCLKTLAGHSSRVTSVAFSLDGCIVISGSDDQTVRLWDVSTGRCLKTLQGHTRQVWSVALSPNGQTLASSSHDQTVRLWDVNTGRCLQILSGHTDCINSVIFISNGHKLASGSDDKTVKLWDTSTGHCLTTLQGHSSRVWSVASCLDTHTLASGSDDQTVKLWDTSTGQCLKTLQGYCNGIWSVTFSPDGYLLASGSSEQTVKLWDTAGQCLKTLHGHDHRVTSVAFSSDNRILASSSEDQTVKLWDTSTGRCLKTLQGHFSRVTSVAFSSDSQILVSGSDDQTLKLWDAATGECFKTLQGHTYLVWSVAFSPDSQTIASGCLDQTVRLWDVNTGKCLKTLQGHSGGIWSVTFSPDGRKLVSGSSDNTFKFWDVSTGECLKTWRGHTNCVYSVTFIDNCTLASASGDQTIKLWDTNTSQCLKTLQGHTKLVWSVAFNPHNKILASASEDGTIRFWDVLNGECLKTLKCERLYEDMDITDVSGVTDAQKAALKLLGAVEYKI